MYCTSPRVPIHVYPYLSFVQNYIVQNHFDEHHYDRLPTPASRLYLHIYIQIHTVAWNVQYSMITLAKRISINICVGYVTCQVSVSTWIIQSSIQTLSYDPRIGHPFGLIDQLNPSNIASKALSTSCKIPGKKTVKLEADQTGFCSDLRFSIIDI